jgi:anhydro-N-acetylmuramic acid kinase
MVGIGLMSGTSLDGLDLCATEFYTAGYRIIASKSVQYDSLWLSCLSNSSSLSAAELFEVDAAFGNFMGIETKKFINEFKLSPDFIASHGHTVHHQPSKGFTVQIGSAHHFQKECNYTFINDFRSKDVALGGQGAPLVPIGDKHLFTEYEACLNLGGFSNISIKKDGRIEAFDICPVNIVFNAICREYFDCDFDRSGDIARSGNLIPELFEELNTIEFYNISGPKSLGVEFLATPFYPILEKYRSKPKEDLMNTLVFHAALQISRVAGSLDTVLTTGGGSKNTFFFELLKNEFSVNLVKPDDQLIDFKEALIFAYMGYLRLQDKVNVLSEVTGAISDSSSGTVYPKQ